MSRPEIAHAKQIVVKANINYVNRTQKNYSMSLKLQIVQETKQRQLTATKGD